MTKRRAVILSVLGSICLFFLLRAVLTPDRFDAFHQGFLQWHLPEGVKARLGTGKIGDVAYSPDGTLLAVAGSIGVWLYDTNTYQVLNLLTGHTGEVNSVSFSPDGTLLASGSTDGTVRLWNAITGEHEQTLIGYSDYRSYTRERPRFGVAHVSFIRDGRLLVHDRYEVDLWDIKTNERKRIANFWGNEGVLSPDGRTLATEGATRTTIDLLDIVSNHRQILTEPEKRITNFFSFPRSPTNSTGISSLSFSMDGQLLASASREDNTIHLWDVDTGTYKRTLDGHRNSIVRLAFSPDGETLASGSHDGTIRLWNVDTGRRKRTLKGYDPLIFVEGVAFSPDGTTLVGTGEYNTVCVWDVKTGKRKKTLSGQAFSARSVAFSPDGRIFASTDLDNHIPLWKKVLLIAMSLMGSSRYADSKGIVHVWDADTGKYQRTLKADKGSINLVTFSPDGQTLVSNTSETIRLWDVETGKRKKTINHEWGLSSFNSTVFSYGGQTFASTITVGTPPAKGSRIHLWDLQTGKLKKTIHLEGYVVNIGGFSPDGRTFSGVFSSFMNLDDLDIYPNSVNTGNIYLWDVATGIQKKTLTGHTDTILEVTFSPDGRTLASTSMDKTIRLWDVGTGALKKTLIRHTTSVHGISFSPDGRTLASWGAYSKRRIYLWDVATGTHKKTLNGHTNYITTVAFSPDSQTLVSASYDGTMLLWDLTATDVPEE